MEGRGGASQPDRFRILAIDGGGSRGILPAIVLADLERRTNRPIIDLFDMIVGTSTGGLIALGLACPGEGGRLNVEMRLKTGRGYVSVGDVPLRE